MGYDDYLLEFVSIKHYEIAQRKIEIAEWKLGIYNPYTTIDYVDFEDNPHYVGWYAELQFQRRLYQAPQRFGKPTFTAICAKHDINSRFKLGLNLCNS